MSKPSYSQQMESIAKQTKSLRIVRYFQNADLRCSHDGLRLIAKENGIDPWELSPGEFLVFANSSQNKLKIYAPGNVIAYVKSPDNRRIDLNLIRLIPRFFNGSEFLYDAAVKELLKLKLAA